MYLNDVKTVLMTLAKHQCPVSTILWGPTGIGKSSIVRQAAEELGYKLHDIRLSQREAVDILGMPFTSKSKIADHENKIHEVDTLDHHAPKWFIEALMGGKVVLFLDELNRARSEVLQAVFELALDRRLNGRKLPDSVLIVSACNPPDQRYDTIEFDDALAARFMHIQVNPNTDTWMDWAKGKNKHTGKQNINPYVTDFIASAKDALNHIHKEDNDFPVELKPTSRSWEFVSLVEELPLVDNIKKQCIRGIVGNELATAYMKSRNSEDRPITVEEIIRMDETVKAKIKRLADVKEGGGKIRADLLKETCRNIERSLLEKDSKLHEHKEHVLDFAEMIPTDLTVSLLQKIFKLQGWAEPIHSREKLVKRLKEMKEAQNNNRVNSIKK